ncbi:MAG: hypothetical protein ACPGVN_08070 [Alphaproteobacteria bacterium]
MSVTNFTRFRRALNSTVAVNLCVGLAACLSANMVHADPNAVHSGPPPIKQAFHGQPQYAQPHYGHAQPVFFQQPQQFEVLQVGQYPVNIVQQQPPKPEALPQPAPEIREIEIPKPYPVEKIREVKIPTPYPVEKIREVRVPYHVPAPVPQQVYAAAPSNRKIVNNNYNTITVNVAGTNGQRRAHGKAAKSGAYPMWGYARSRVNLRACPTLMCSIESTASKGQPLLLSTCNNTWCRTTIDRKPVFVSRKYVGIQ